MNNTPSAPERYTNELDKSLLGIIILTLNNINNVFDGTFSGNGSSLFGLNPANFNSGTATAQLTLNNFNNVFDGNFSGNGVGLTNLNPANLAAGGVSAQLSLTNANNNFSGNFAGSFGGNFSGENQCV